MACAAVTLASGCGSVDGSPAAASLGGAQFDPCTIPDEAISAAGADPGTKEAGIFGVDLKDWNVCSWDSSWYFLSILSTDHTFNEIKENPQSLDFKSVDIGRRDAVSYLDISDTAKDVCDVAFPSSQGVIVIRISTKGTAERMEDPCAVAVRAGVSLGAALPDR